MYMYVCSNYSYSIEVASYLLCYHAHAMMNDCKVLVCLFVWIRMCVCVYHCVYACTYICVFACVRMYAYMCNVCVMCVHNCVSYLAIYFVPRITKYALSNDICDWILEN